MTIKYNVKIIMLEITKVAHVYDNYITIYLLFIYFIEFNNKSYLSTK